MERPTPIGEQLCLRLLYGGCAFLLLDAERGLDGEY